MYHWWGLLHGSENVWFPIINCYWCEWKTRNNMNRVLNNTSLYNDKWCLYVCCMSTVLHNIMKWNSQFQLLFADHSQTSWDPWHASSLLHLASLRSASSLSKFTLSCSFLACLCSSVSIAFLLWSVSLLCCSLACHCSENSNAVCRLW